MSICLFFIAHRRLKKKQPSYIFFWVFPWRQIVVGRRFGTLYQFHLQDALLSFLFNFVLDFTTRRVQLHQDGWILNGTHQFLVYADDVNMLSTSIHTIKKNTEALVVAC